MRSSSPFRFLSFLLLFFSSPPSEAGGIISGVVRYQGVRPPPQAIPVTADEPFCGKRVLSQGLVIGEKGGIKNAVVSLQGPVIGGRPFPRPVGGFVMNQKNCQFEPHVLLMAPGPLQILNSDPILHNIHSRGHQNPERSETQPPSAAGKTTSDRTTSDRTTSGRILTFEQPEIVEIRCDLHDWMQAWVVVADQVPTALTDENGVFKLTDIPAGDYTLNLWHESLGTKSQRVHVDEGGETQVTFRLTPFR